MGNKFNSFGDYGYAENVAFEAKTYEVSISENDKIISVTENGSLLATVKLGLDNQTLSLIGKDGKEDYECFENIEIELFKKQMLKLLRGQRVVLPTFNFKLQKKEFNRDPIKLGENDILIIEGIHALNPKASDFIPKDKVFKLYVAPMVSIRFDSYTMLSSNDLRMMRRFVRDNSVRGVSVERTMDLWEKIRIGDEQNIFPYVDRADYIFNTSLIYEWAVLKPIAEKLLLKIRDDSMYYSEARRLLNTLRNFIGIDTNLIPSTSILREFIGGGCYLR